MKRKKSAAQRWRALSIERRQDAMDVMRDYSWIFQHTEERSRAVQLAIAVLKEAAEKPKARKR